MNKREQLELLDEQIFNFSNEIDEKVEQYRRSISESLIVLRNERGKLYRELNYGMNECELVTPATIIKIIKAAKEKGEI